MPTSIITTAVIALLAAIRAVESTDGLDASADGNEYQITRVCLADVNRIYATDYRWPEDVKDRETAKQIVVMYLSYYGVRYFEDYHRLPSDEVLAKIYHCGYKGFRRGDKRGADYWRKVKAAKRDKAKAKRKGGAK